jgi:hypothetical protein
MRLGGLFSLACAALIDLASQKNGASNSHPEPQTRDMQCSNQLCFAMAIPEAQVPGIRDFILV